MANGNGGAISPFGPAKREKQSLTVDWDVLKAGLANRLEAAGHEVEEEDLEDHKREVEKIMSDPKLKLPQQIKELTYLLGFQKRPVPRGPKKSKEEKKEAARSAAAKRRDKRKAGFEALGFSVSNKPRVDRTAEEKEENKKANAKARRTLKTRNRQVLAHLLPDFHSNYLGKTPGKPTSDTVEALQLARAAKTETGRDVLTQMQIDLAAEALQVVGFSPKEARQIAQRKKGGPTEA